MCNVTVFRESGASARPESNGKTKRLKSESQSERRAELTERRLFFLSFSVRPIFLVDTQHTHVNDARTHKTINTPIDTDPCPCGAHRQNRSSQPNAGHSLVPMLATRAR